MPRANSRLRETWADNPEPAANVRMSRYGSNAKLGPSTAVNPVTAAELRRLLPSEGSAMTRSRLLAAAAASALVVIGLVGCAPPEKKESGNQTESGVNAKEATSAADFGGMDGLVKA